MDKTKEFSAALTEHLPAETCAAHQAFLAFNGDDEGIAFREWWNACGAKLFAEWFAAYGSRR